MAMAVGAVAPNLLVAVLYGQAIVIPMILFAGLMVNMEMCIVIIRWI